MQRCSLGKTLIKTFNFPAAPFSLAYLCRSILLNEKEQEIDMNSILDLEYKYKCGVVDVFLYFSFKIENLYFVTIYMYTIQLYMKIYFL